jgi:hypothetical protein
MNINSNGPLQGRLLVVLFLCLVLPVALAGGTSKAAPSAQTPTPTPNATATKPILLTDPISDPHQDGVLYFAQTGHTLRGKFLTYWQQYGGLAQFGYPLTEEFFEPSGPNNSPLQVQYFERNRFELHPENQPPYDVLLGTLSREFRAQDPPPPQLPSPALYFPETGHNLSGKFLDYWQSHGGLAVHGYPITEAVMEQSTNGKEYLVQWFERSRMELHPENAGSEYEVLLGLEGRQLSEKKGYPFGWYPPYGRALDYSWLAGHSAGPSQCMETICACVIFIYESASVKSERQAVAVGVASTWRYARDGRPSVVFGRLVSGELDPVCRVPDYFMDRMQPNPAQ